MLKVPTSPLADEDRPNCRSQVPAASFSLSRLTIKAILLPKSLREKKPDDSPCLLPVIVYFIPGQPDRQEALFPFFFIWCLRWVESICCLIKALQPAGRPQPLADRDAVTDPTSSLQRLFCTMDVAICFQAALRKHKRHSFICGQ